MSLRKQAKILGISHSYLSMMINGKRPRKDDIKKRYEELVTTNTRVGEKKWCPGRDSNPHSLTEKRILSPPRLPFRHLGMCSALQYIIQDGYLTL